MSIFDNFFQYPNRDGTSDDNRGKISEHSVTVEFYGGLDSLEELHALEEELDNLLQQTGTGYCDGHEVSLDLDHGYLFLYGVNAESVFKTVKPILESRPFMKGAVAFLKFGSYSGDASEIEVTL